MSKKFMMLTSFSILGISCATSETIDPNTKPIPQFIENTTTKKPAETELTEKKTDIIAVSDSLDLSPIIYCPDDIYAKHLKKTYKDEQLKKIYALKSRHSRRSALRSLKLQAKHHVSQKLDGDDLDYFGAIPVVETPRVEMWMDYFQTRGRSDFLKWLVRSETYKDLVMPILTEQGLPKELFYLAMIESGFSNTAYSRARATGTWQFMKRTGQHYGLNVNYWIDERRDPVKATKAATAFLKDLYREFDDWYLAIAAYNAGPGKVRRAIRKTKSRDFWTISRSRYLKSETKHYVPKMLAALLIASNPERFGFHVVADVKHRTPTATVYVKRPTRLSDIATHLDIKLSLLRRWNPELLRGITPPGLYTDPEGYALRLPKDYVEKYATIEPKLEKLKISDVKIYKIKPGDTLSTIASKHKIPLRKLLNLNPKIHPKKLRPGKAIAIPIPVVIGENGSGKG
jgi:membrane-bound lytic murein transglycosylase D